MRYNKQLIPATAFLCVFLCVLCVSCTKQGLKTVVMGDNAAGNVSEAAHSGKAYKINYFNVIDNKPVNEMLFGWLDKDNTAAVVDKQDDYLTIEAINYKYHFSKEIMKITSDMPGYSLSPDGEKIAYVKGERLFIKDIQAEKDKEIGQIHPLGRSSISISWSNNSRFITLAVISYPNGIEQVSVYDNTVQKMYEISLKKESAAASELVPAKTLNYNVTISDDGTKLMINSLYEDGEYKIGYLEHLYKLNRETFLPETEIKISSAYIGNACFIDNNRLIYLNMRSGSLNIYNAETGEDSEIYKFDKNSMKYQYFKASNDGKAIVFLKYLQDGTVGIYEAEIQNNALENERMIYEDFVPNNICWSGDNKKVLLSGRYAYSEKTDKARQQLSPSYVSLGNVIIELN